MSSRVTGSGPGPRDGVPPAAPLPKPDAAAPAATAPLRRIVRVTNPLGLHHRAADRFSRAAKVYASAVTVCNGDLRADGKSLWDLMGLVVFPDTEVVLEVNGPDAAEAIGPLAAILGAPGGEDYSI